SSPQTRCSLLGSRICTASRSCLDQVLQYSVVTAIALEPPFKNMRHTSLGVRHSHDIRSVFDRLNSVIHGDANPCPFEHLNVIWHIAKRHYVFLSNSVVAS